MRPPAWLWGVSLLTLNLLASGGCRPHLRLAPTGEHGDRLVRTVPYPPPVAQVELIPAPPSPEAVWVDGSWRFNGRDYLWKSGRWQLPKPGAYYARPKLVRRRNGELLYFGGHWHEPSAAQ